MTNDCVLSGNVELRPTEVRLENAFIASAEKPIVSVGLAVTGSMSGNWFHCIGAYTPRLFRRKRLRRFAPLSQAVVETRSFWRWRRGIRL